LAWDEFEHSGHRGTSGDKPIDEAAAFLRKTSEHYLDRWQRKPTTAEVLYAMSAVLRSNAPRYVADPPTAAGWAKGFALSTVEVAPETSIIDVHQYEGMYGTRPAPHHRIERRSDEEMVIEIPVLEPIDGTLHVEYRILDDSLTEADVERLVRIALLQIYVDDYYKEEASQIRFHNLDTGRNVTGTY
jgi:hypothetical protein